MRYLAILAMTAALVGAGERLPYSPDSAGPEAQAAYAKLLARDWAVAFADDGTGNWTEGWFLDGKQATVTNTPDGMELRAGPEVDPAHHAVLWTKESFKGDVKIEYEYTRLDEATEFVTILYIQATGDGKQGRDADIAKWADQRTTPDMWRYFKGMHLYHISYAAFDAARGTPEYIRARRYMPGTKKKEYRWPDGVALKPDYLKSGFWQTGKPHKVTVIKQDRDLWMEIDNGEKRQLCHWRNDRLSPVLEGRIGLRHMHTRQARYKGFTVSVPKAETMEYSTLVDDEDAPTDTAVPVTDRAAWQPYYSRLNLQHGMHHEGKTYFCFHGDGADQDDPYVMAYDHGAKTFTGPCKAGDTVLPDADNHGNPGLIVDDLGHVHVVYGGHGKVAGGGMRHVRTVKPGDITTWERLDNIPGDATYPKLFKMSDGTIYYTHRDGSHAHGHVLHRSVDHGATFAKPVAFLGGGFKNGGKRHQDGVYARKRYFDAWYTHARQGTGDSIHFMVFYHACSVRTPKDARHNEHGERRLNLYYLKYEHATRTWHTVTGQDITKRLPLNLHTANGLCLVYESQVKAQPGKVDNVGLCGMGLTPDDRPILSYVSSGDYPLKKDFTVSRLAFGHADGWKHLATAKDPAPGIRGIPADVVSFDEFSLYTGGGILRTTDGGKTWKRIRRFADGERGVAHLSHIYRPHPEARFIAADGGHKNDDDGVKIYLWGEKGFLAPTTKEKE